MFAYLTIFILKCLSQLSFYIETLNFLSQLIVQVLMVSLIFDMKTIMNILNADCADVVRSLQRKSRIQKILIITITVISSLAAQGLQIVVT